MALRDLVLLHGGGVGPWMWRALRRELEGEAAVHTPVLRGHHPGAPAHYTDPHGAARDVAAELDAVAGRDLVVVGFSAGGQVALEFAALHPDAVTGLVIVSSLVEPFPGRRLLSAIGALSAPLARRPGFAARQAVALGIEPEDVPAYVEGSIAFSRESLRGLMRSNFAYRPRPEVITHPRPLLLMAGGREQRVLRAGLQRLAAAAPDGRYVEVTGASHDIPLRHAGVLADELRELL